MSFETSKGLKRTKVHLDLAPPYLNGNLHLGHLYEYCSWYPFYMSLDRTSVLKCFENTDLLKYDRFPRYQLIANLGLDVNGLPVSREAEKVLKARGIETPSEEELKTTCDQLISTNEKKVKELLRKLGMYELKRVREYKTNDEFFSKNLDRCFENLTSEVKLVKQPQMYCRMCKTVLSNFEVQKCLEDRRAYTFELKSSKGEIYTVMTTRPEFLPGISGVACNPADSRYQSLIGQDLEVRVLDVVKKVKVYASQKVHSFVGTGLVYFTNWSNHLDVEITRDLGLESGFNLYDQTGEVPDLVRKEYFKANEKDYPDLMNTGDFQKMFSEGELRSQVKILRHTERSDCNSQVIFIAPVQVALNVSDQDRIQLKQKVQQMVIYPETAKNHLLKNLEQLKNWCVSRGKNYYSFTKEFQNRRFKVDTWLLSAMTPAYEPRPSKTAYSVWRLQGAEILRTWALYSLYLNQLMKKHDLTQANLDRIFAHRHVLDEFNQKISKSKKNGPDVVSLLEDHSIPELRIYFCQKPIDKDFSFKQKELNDVRTFLRKFFNLKRKVDLQSSKEILDPALEYSFKQDLKRVLRGPVAKEPNYAAPRYSFSLEDVVLRFRNYFSDQVPFFNMSGMVSYVKFLVYHLSKKIQTRAALFEDSRYPQWYLASKVLGFVEGYLRTFGIQRLPPIQEAPKI